MFLMILAVAVPWYLVSHRLFGHVGKSGGGLQAAQSLFSKEDVRHPVQLVGKVVVSAITVPWVTSYLFVREAVLPTAATVCDHVWHAVVSSVTFLCRVAPMVLVKFMAVCNRMFVALVNLLEPLLSLVWELFTVILRGTYSVLAWLWRNLCVPVGHKVYDVLVALLDGAVWLWTHVVYPVWRAVRVGVVWTLDKLSRGASWLFDVVWEAFRFVSVGVYEVVHWLLVRVRRCGVAVGGWVWAVVHPILTALQAVMSWLLRTAVRAASWVWEYLLRPVWTAITAAVAWALRCAAVGAQWLWAAVFIPVGTAIAAVIHHASVAVVAVLSAVSAAVVAVVAPLVRAVGAFAWQVGSAATGAAAATVAWVGNVVSAVFAAISRSFS